MAYVWLAKALAFGFIVVWLWLTTIHQKAPVISHHLAELWHMLSQPKDWVKSGIASWCIQVAFWHLYGKPKDWPMPGNFQQHYREKEPSYFSFSSVITEEGKCTLLSSKILPATTPLDRKQLQGYPFFLSVSMFYALKQFHTPNLGSCINSVSTIHTRYIIS